MQNSALESVKPSRLARSRRRQLAVPFFGKNFGRTKAKPRSADERREHRENARAQAARSPAVMCPFKALAMEAEPLPPCFDPKESKRLKRIFRAFTAPAKVPRVNGAFCHERDLKAYAPA